MSTLASRLDKLPFGRFHRRLLVTSGLGWMFDAMDVGIISFVIAALIQEWQLSQVEAGLIGSIGFVGMFLGAAVAGVLADRFGRKGIFQITLLIYSIATGLSALAGNLLSLLGLRLLVGFGLGGELPVAGTLVSEFAPAKHRGRMVVLLESFWAFGWFAAALIARFVIPEWSWRAAFLIGSLPALYVFVIRRRIPESPRYLETKGKFAEADAIVESIERESGVQPPKERTRTIYAKQSSTFIDRLRELWSRRYIRRTAMIWMLWFGIVLSYYGIFTWLPSILAGEFSLVKSYDYTLIITVAQIPGYFSAAYLVEKIGRKPTLVIYLLATALFAYLFGTAGSAMFVLLWGCLMSFFNLGAWGVVYTYSPEIYPTRMRGTGSGMAASFGRIGGIIGPYLVGILLGTFGLPTGVIFTFFAIVLILTALNVFILGEETKGKTLEEIAE